MGDPKRIRKKYETPRHPWIGSRIQEEKELRKEYGLANKKEIWKMGTLLKRFKDRAKSLIAQSGDQAVKEREQLIARMARLGLIKADATFDDILGLTINNIVERRLQTVMVRKNLARSPRQARQMIVHRHVIVGDSVVTSPSYLVTVDEEPTIGFTHRSNFANEQHPERFSEEELAQKRAKEVKKTAEGAEREEALTFDEKEIEKAEVLAGEKKVESVKEELQEEQKSKSEESAEKPPTTEESSTEAAEKQADSDGEKASPEKSEEPARTEPSETEKKAEKGDAS